MVCSCDVGKRLHDGGSTVTPDGLSGGVAGRGDLGPSDLPLTSLSRQSLNPCLKRAVALREALIQRENVMLRARPTETVLFGHRGHCGPREEAGLTTE